MEVPVCDNCGEKMHYIYMVDRYRFSWTEDHGYLSDPTHHDGDDPDEVVTECTNCGAKHNYSLLRKNKGR